MQVLWFGINIGLLPLILQVKQLLDAIVHVKHMDKSQDKHEFAVKEA
jgi:hypothetical protein